MSLTSVSTEASSVEEKKMCNKMKTKEKRVLLHEKLPIFRKGFRYIDRKCAAISISS